ncbi:hypothetical protein EC957_009127 [Mortierella hygrophila]|uniref:Uncharacterized protein n=1 Tax=Mortierella hygrophila TaxID=979708 RepID=A0A9P6EX33_9FUNG|nr:hypothetical protein EC957_009127 [Mortierella hygrophila]
MKAPVSPDDTSTSRTKKDIGTLKTHIERVLSDRPDLQLEAINCIKKCSELAADIKRKAQGLIGGFLEKLRTRMKAAEEFK